MKNVFLALALAAILGLSMAACKNGNNDNSGGSTTYTVTYDKADGSPRDPGVAVSGGGKVAAPTMPTREFDFSVAGLWKEPYQPYVFEGWYDGDEEWIFESNTVTANVTLTARWSPPASEPLVPLGGPSIVAQAISHINAPGNQGVYTLALDASLNIGAVQNIEAGRDLTIISTGGERTIHYVGTGGSIFSLSASGTTLRLKRNITLRGIESNNAPLVNIAGGGMLTLETGAKIVGNTSGGGSAVSLAGAGTTFVMYGGEISGMTSAGANAAAVRIADGATFTMNGGIIQGNTASGDNSGSGALVTGANSVFTLEGGNISGMTSLGANSAAVRVADGATLNMNGGKIHENTANGASSAGGVILSDGSFTMRGGEISGNTAGGADSKGGVLVTGDNSVFTPETGLIQGNTPGDR
ncbi:MAG: hypothetical protein FWE09_01215 [Treponema sp.]|nr:hypothetical protein [Treponema sp.]